MGEISGEGDVTTYPPAPDGSEHLSGLNDGFAYNTIKVRIPVSGWISLPAEFAASTGLLTY